MARAHFEFGESNGRCDHCDSRTVLVSFSESASVDREPFASGEYAEDSPEAKQGISIPEDVEVNDEITGHYCLQCACLTTLCINPPHRHKYSEHDPKLEARLFKQRMKDRGIHAAVTFGKVTMTNEDDISLCPPINNLLSAVERIRSVKATTVSDVYSDGRKVEFYNYSQELVEDLWLIVDAVLEPDHDFVLMLWKRVAEGTDGTD